jgi:ADP-heptose:LPS heptosyltransferase
MQKRRRNPNLWSALREKRGCRNASAVSDTNKNMNLSKDILKAFSCLPHPWISRGIADVLTNRAVQRLIRQQEERLVQSAGNPEHILLIADVNIGDSINILSAAEALKHHFPKSRIDYIHNATATPLVREHPAIFNSLPLFKNPFIPREEEGDMLLQQASRGDYDLILNFCPFLSIGRFKKIAPVLAPLSLTGKILDALACEDAICQIRFKIAEHIDHLFAPISGKKPFTHARPNYRGPALFLPSEAHRAALSWMNRTGIAEKESLIFLNPDASNRYNKIPEPFQAEILRRVLDVVECDHLLLGAGFKFEGISHRLGRQLSGALRRKIILVDRSLSIDVYASVTDTCNVYITADTGPMHIAASRKKAIDGENIFRNRTSILSIFGPTLSRVYGYDSEKPGHIPADQNAPSRVFNGICPGKSLLCSLERILKKCNGERCFAGVDAKDVAQAAQNSRHNALKKITTKRLYKHAV